MINVTAAFKLNGAKMRVHPVVITPIKTLRPNPRNARTHPKRKILQLANSIRRFGAISPIVADEHGLIIAGHARYLAAIELGLKEIPVMVVAGMTENEKRALALADNRLAENSGWDRKILATELRELALVLPEIDLDLEALGFEAAAVDNLLGDFPDPEQDPCDDLPAPAEHEPTSRQEDLWLLGDHRLAAGDACRENDVHALMKRERAAMAFADPPYNVRIASVQGRGRTKHREFMRGSGEMSPPQFTNFLVKSLSLLAQYSKEGSIHYVFMDWRHMGELHSAGQQVYRELKNLVVWSKTNPGQGSFYRSQHELIFVFKNGEGPHQNNVELGRHGRNRSNVWTYPGVNTFRTNRMDELSLHPTVKPVALAADAMRDCSRRGDIILDPFMGSGTTILAAERIGRRAYGLEIDPTYVDVAIRRWQAFTKRDAILKATGQTFHEVEEERRAPKLRRVR
jgi:DNA modification methylase